MTAKAVKRRGGGKRGAQIPPDVRAKAAELFAAGGSRAEVAQGLRDAGLRVPCAGSLERIRKAAKVSAPSAPSAGGEHEAFRGEMLAALRGMLAHFRAIADEAGEDRDSARLTQAMRGLNALVEKVIKLMPPAREDPDANPDMVKAAAECREQLHALLNRVLEDPDHPFRRPPATG